MSGTQLAEHKKVLIDRAAEVGVMKLGEFILKSGRPSPYFLNYGEFNLGKDTLALGRGYAKAIVEAIPEVMNDPEQVKRVKIYGPPQKGIPLAIATSIALAEMGIDAPWFFTRPAEQTKTYGEATNISKAEKAKGRIVGSMLKDGDIVIMVDDVITTGDTKTASMKELNELADNLKFPLIVISADRQEVTPSGENAVEKLAKDTGAKVVSVIKAIEIHSHLSSKSPQTDEYAWNLGKMINYLRVYGVEDIRPEVGRIRQENIFSRDRGIIIAADLTSLEDLRKIVKETADIPEIVGIKTGQVLGLKFGLKNVVGVISEGNPQLVVIHDNQKAGGDVPDTIPAYARVLSEAGVKGAIFFTHSGPETERAAIYQSVINGLKPIIGGWMTHPAYTESEGGFMSDRGAMRIYKVALQIGVDTFVVPATKPEVIAEIKTTADSYGFEVRFMAPGIGKQGGSIEEVSKILGKSWFPIIGREITQAEDKRAAALAQVEKLGPYLR